MSPLGGMQIRWTCNRDTLSMIPEFKERKRGSISWNRQRKTDAIHFNTCYIFTEKRNVTRLTRKCITVYEIAEQFMISLYLIEWREPEMLGRKCMAKYMKRSETCLSINVWIWLVVWSRKIFIFGERFHRASRITYNDHDLCNYGTGMESVSHVEI